MADNELTDIRSIRREIYNEYGGDLERVFDYYEEVQDRLKASGRYKFVNKPIRRDMSSRENRRATNH